MKNERAATADRFVMNARTLIVGEWHCPYPGAKFLRAYLPPSIVFVPAVSAVRYLGVDARTEREANVSFGSLADMPCPKRHVCFTPESGHCNRDTECRLRARTGSRRL